MRLDLRAALANESRYRDLTGRAISSSASAGALGWSNLPGVTGRLVDSVTGVETRNIRSAAYAVLSSAGALGWSNLPGVTCQLADSLLGRFRGHALAGTRANQCSKTFAETFKLWPNNVLDGNCRNIIVFSVNIIRQEQRNKNALTLGASFEQ